MVMPLTKYFCTRGKTNITGRVVSTVMTIRAVFMGRVIWSKASVLMVPDSSWVMLLIMP